MDDVDDLDGPFEALAGLVAVATLPAGILAATFLGGDAAVVVFVFGWLFLVPVFGILSRVVDTGNGTETATRGSERQPGSTDDEALRRLRERYARGEVDEAEFERRVERLLEAETLDVGSGASGELERSLERDSE